MLTRRIDLGFAGLVSFDGLLEVTLNGLALTAEGEVQAVATITCDLPRLLAATKQKQRQCPCLSQPRCL